jgi:two-component system LytT family response regulator
MIKVLIVDDEQHCIDRLISLLIPTHEKLVEIIGTAQSVEEAIRAITLLKPDLIFLDVQLGEKTGFDLLRMLPDINFAIIFTTAFEKFAIQAIKFSAIDYLLKPVDEDDLNIALFKLGNEKVKKIMSDKINLLLDNTQKINTLPQKMMVHTISGFEYINIADIVRCESDINYTTIYFNDKTKLMVAKTLKDFEELLANHSFFRVHNSHLINLYFVKSYNKGKGGSVKLTDSTEIEVSSRRKDEFLKKLAIV